MQFADTIRSYFGDHLEIEQKPLPSDDPKVRRPDISKAKRVLNWEPRVPLHEGLKSTIEYFQNLTEKARNGIASSIVESRTTQLVDVPSAS